MGHQMSETATAIMESREKHRLAYAMDHLLHRLRRFMAAYPREMDKPMPDHDLVWLEGLNGDGPAQTILDAMPPEVCIVSRKALEDLGLSADAINLLAEMGEYVVAISAAHHEHNSQSH